MKADEFNFAAVESHLRLTIECLSALAAADRAQALEFIEHREYGVAFDWIVDAASSDSNLRSQLAASPVRRAALLLGEDYQVKLKGVIGD